MAIDFIDNEMLEELINYRDDVCISIYLPMAQRGADVQGNPVRLENELKDVKAQVQERGFSKTQIDELLQEARDLIDDSQYWQQQQEGLALFLAPGFFDVFRLPTRLEPLTVITGRFHVKPLLAFLSGDGQYYILALSQDNVRLLRATHHNLEEIDAEQIPVSMEEALAFEDPEEQLQHHTTTAGGSGSPKGSPDVVHHGHSMDDEERQRLRRFLKEVAGGVAETLPDNRAPLVVTAVDYMHPMFAEAYREDNLVGEGIETSLTEISDEEMHRRSWEIVAPLFKQAQEEARATFDNLKHTDQASDDVSLIVPAAFQGRIDILFIARDVHEWGEYDVERNEIRMNDSGKSNSDDLLDFAAVHTLANGGDVYVVDGAEMPGATSIAAILRF